MKTFKKITTLIFSLVLLCNFSPLIAEDEGDHFLGRWALHFEEGMGWLEVRQEDGYLDADLLWRGGSVTPVSNVFISNGKLVVTRTSTTAFEKADGKLKRAF